jgi:uncharacterized RDD family membrane protein YckC
MTQIPAGWYPDPAPQTIPGRQRYWDGTQWTEHLHDPQPAPPAYPQAPQYPQTAQYPQYPQYQPTEGQQVPVYAPAASSRPTTPDGAPLSGWWRRVLARVLDGFIALPLFVLAASPVVASQWDELQKWADDISYAIDNNTADPPTPALFDVTTGPGFALVLSGLAAYFVYELVFLFWKQATPGKLIVGLRVRRRESPDLPASSILGRVGFGLVGQFCGLVLLLDYLWPLWDSKNQALHDKVARTNVVLARAPSQAGYSQAGYSQAGYSQAGYSQAAAAPPTEAGLPRRW